MMDISDAGHDDKGKIVQDPSDNWVYARVVDVTNFIVAEIIVPPLPAQKVPKE